MNCLSVFDHFWGLARKGLNLVCEFLAPDTAGEKMHLNNLYPSSSLLRF